jgi:hypothetical protein
MSEWTNPEEQSPRRTPRNPFFQTFCGCHQYPNLRYLCFYVVLGPLGNEFHFGGKSHTNNMRITKNTFCFCSLMINDQYDNLYKTGKFHGYWKKKYFGHFTSAPPSDLYCAESHHSHCKSS